MKTKTLYFAVLLLLLVAPVAAFATTATGGGGLPWEGPLETFKNSITGPVALSVAVLAIGVAGAMLIFGGEINNFARMSVYIVLIAGLLASANNVFATLYGTGAVVPAAVTSVLSSALL